MGTSQAVPQVDIGKHVELLFGKNMSAADRLIGVSTWHLAPYSVVGSIRTPERKGEYAEEMLPHFREIAAEGVRLADTYAGFPKVDDVREYAQKLLDRFEMAAAPYLGLQHPRLAPGIDPGLNP
tara:strand:+ start:9457 stop:9828 length:372 start_codon:yes stop_codon:yes gene_type:complete